MTPRSHDRGIISAMTTKEQAHRVIQLLPDEASMEDIIHALYVQSKFARGDRQIDQGQGVPHEQAKERLAKWLK